jgi:hypothetical protein
MRRTRPTLRARREDLALPVPGAETPLDEIQHPLLAKASDQFTDDDARHERIRAIDDEILFKVKIGRWRGAVWPGDPCSTDTNTPRSSPPSSSASPSAPTSTTQPTYQSASPPQSRKIWSH